MKYEVYIKHAADSGDGISIEAEVNGETIPHTVPKGAEFTGINPETGNPRVVDKLVDKYKEKKRKGRSITAEEEKLDKNHLEGETFKVGLDKGEIRSALNNEENQGSNHGENVELDNPKQIREYLKDNMDEGYLSESEEENIDRLVDKYDELLTGNSRDNDEKIEKMLKEVFAGKVQ